jgi:3-phosphoglycerate kinase
VKSQEKIVNIGPRTLRHFITPCFSARMIVWNGPLGVCEVDQFCTSTQLMARAIAASAAKVKIVGGGDTIPIIEHESLVERLTFVSTGGGAMLAFLAGETLPGLGE